MAFLSWRVTALGKRVNGQIPMVQATKRSIFFCNNAEQAPYLSRNASRRISASQRNFQSRPTDRLSTRAYRCASGGYAQRIDKGEKKLRTYHKTDTHWNSYGAYVGYRQMMKQMKKELKGIKTVSIKRKTFTMVSGPAGDLANSLNLQQSLSEDSPRPTKWNATCLGNSTLKGVQNDAARNQQWFTTSCADKKYRAVMFRDSYSLAMMPYLSETFEHIYYIPHSPVSIGNMKKIVTEQRPDIVLEQRTTRWLRTPEG